MEKIIDVLGVLRNESEQQDYQLMKNDKSPQEKEDIKDFLVAKHRDGQYRLVTEQARYPIHILGSIFDSNSLTPDYQRNQVWDDTKKSRLIESFIMNVPIPPVFLYESEYAKYEVMDGLQRISTILSFYKDSFALENLEIWPELNSFKYSELPSEIRSEIDRRYLSAIILLKESSSTVEKEYELKRFVFSRLNTGGLELSDQEVRNALHTSKFNEMIKDVALNNSYLKAMFPFTDKEVDRMENYELVLRFFTYLSATELKISKAQAKMLDDFSYKAIDFSSEFIEELKTLFKETISIVNRVFGDVAFLKEKNKGSTKMLFDTLMICIAHIIIKEEFSKTQLKSLDLTEKKFDWIIQSEDQDLFNGKFTSTKWVNDRIEFIKNKIIIEIEAC